MDEQELSHQDLMLIKKHQIETFDSNDIHMMIYDTITSTDLLIESYNIAKDLSQSEAMNLLTIMKLRECLSDVDVWLEQKFNLEDTEDEL
jgi:hypothetical protein